ncbi:MAG: PAS domain-containing sensor histidine kinase [Candidatus Aminicenantales bacterium]
MNLSFINPNECVENAIKLAKTQTNEKDISFNFKRLENNTPVLLDADKIQEVMLNLILNSISAIQKRGEISIKLDQNQNNNLEIIVSDNGKGIKKENLPHIFKPFFTTKKGGTGLGLSICKKIIEAHSGAVKVESSEEKGTTFIIQLPGLNPSN